MARRRSAHLMRIIIEGVSSYSPYRGGKISYRTEYDPNPTVNVDLITKMDVMRGIQALHKRGELSIQEIQMLAFVMADGRLSRRDISKLVEKELGYYVDQRTVSRRLDSAYWKLSKFLGFEYSDSRLFKLVAKEMGRRKGINDYILSDDEIDEVQTICERQ